MTNDEKRVTIAALDLFARVLCLQVEAVPEELRSYYLISVAGRNSPLSLESLNRFAREVGLAKSALDMPPNASLGIYNPRVHPAARLARDLALRLDGRHEETGGPLSAEADAQWTEIWGEPWYGARLRGEDAP